MTHPWEPCRPSSCNGFVGVDDGHLHFAVLAVAIVGQAFVGVEAVLPPGQGADPVVVGDADGNFHWQPRTH